MSALIEDAQVAGENRGMNRHPLADSWEATEVDLRWVLRNADLDDQVVACAEDMIDHNELGEAWDVIDATLRGRSGEVAERMESAGSRMGLP